MIKDGSPFGLQLSEVTLPEALDRGGDWSAAAIGKWHLTGHRATDPLRDPLAQGFDRVRGSRGNLQHRRSAALSYTVWEKNVDGVLVDANKYATIDTTDEAIAAIKELPQPFFLWVSYNAPHEPYHFPPGMRVRRGRGAAYDAMVTYMDAEIGRMLAAMDPEVRAKTTIVFMGDNGSPQEAIRPPFRPNHGKPSIHEGGIGVPLIVAGSGVTGRGESQALVHGVDLLPTVLDLAGVDVGELPIDGVSFAAQLVAPDAPGARKYVFTELLRPNGPPPYTIEEVAIRDDRYKLMRARSGQWGRYDLEGRYDEGKRVPPGVAEDRFRALQLELQRIRSTVHFDATRDPAAEGLPATDAEGETVQQP